MATEIADLTNESGKDGLLKDVYLDKRKAKAKEGREKAKSLRKTIFGPHSSD